MADKSLAAVFVAFDDDNNLTGYDVVCTTCGWEFEGNPFYNVFDADAIAEAHRCGESDARQRS